MMDEPIKMERANVMVDNTILIDLSDGTTLKLSYEQIRTLTAEKLSADEEDAI